MFRVKILLHTYIYFVSYLVRDFVKKKGPSYLRRRAHNHPDFRIVFLRCRAPEILEPDIRYREVALTPDVVSGGGE